MKKILIILFILLLIYIFNNKIEAFTLEKKYAEDNDEWIEPIVYNNIITEEEAKYIIDNVQDKLVESEILSGLNKNIRKSKTAWLYKNDNVIYNIINKICKLTNYSIDNAEPLQIVKYEPDGFYNEHHDACCDDNSHCDKFIEKSGQRAVTMVIYLTDGFTDGGTFFPKLNKIYKPNKCGGLLFYPLSTNTSKCHPKALHAGMPVTSGIKYIANVWLREKKFNL